MILLSACTGAKFRYLNKVRVDRKPQPTKVITTVEKRNTASVKTAVPVGAKLQETKLIPTNKQALTLKKQAYPVRKTKPVTVIQLDSPQTHAADTTVNKANPRKEKKTLNASAISTWLLFGTFILIFFAASTELPILIFLVLLGLLAALFFGIYGWLKNRKKYSTATKISFWLLITMFASIALALILLPEVFAVVFFIAFLGSIVFGLLGILSDSSNQRKEFGIPRKKYEYHKPDDLAISQAVLAFLIFLLAFQVLLITALFVMTLPVSILILTLVLLTSSLILGIIALLKFIKAKNWILAFSIFSVIILNLLFILGYMSII